MTIAVNPPSLVLARELTNVLERAVFLHDGEELRADDLGLKTIAARGATAEMDSAGVRVDFSRGGVSLAQIECTLTAEARRVTGGSRLRAAEQLDISVETLRDRIEKYGLTGGGGGGSRADARG